MERRRWLGRLGGERGEVMGLTIDGAGDDYHALGFRCTIGFWIVRLEIVSNSSAYGPMCGCVL